MAKTIGAFSAIVLLAACQSTVVERDIHVEIRSPEHIALEGSMWDKPGALGLAYRFGPTRCRIVVPPLTFWTLRIWHHELRHCAEGHFHD